jgi:hypothetical protein
MTQTQTKDHEKTQRGVGQRTDLQEDTNPADTLISDFSFQ